MTKELTSLIHELVSLIGQHAPDNRATYPFSLSMIHDDSTGEPGWWTCVHIQTPRADFNIENTKPDPSTSVAGVVHQLKRFNHTMRVAITGDRRFGVTYETT